MVAIETTHGRFEAETIREAQKLERKAAREAAKREAERGKLRDQARIRAAAVGYTILARKAESRSFPAGYRFRPAESLDSTHTVQPLQTEFSRQCRLMIDAEHGKAEFDSYGIVYLGYVENGAGWPMAIAVRDSGCPTVVLHAVGACDGELATVILPGIQPEDFRQAGEPTEAYRARIGAEC